MDFKKTWSDYKSEPVAAAQPADLETSKIFAILSYFWILFFLPLVCCKDSPFGKFHANQGLVLLIFSIVTGIALTVATTILAFIPVLGVILISVLSATVGIANVALLIIGVLNAANGEYRRLPVIGKVDLIK